MFTDDALLERLRVSVFFVQDCTTLKWAVSCMTSVAHSRRRKPCTLQVNKRHSGPHGSGFTRSRPDRAQCRFAVYAQVQLSRCLGMPCPGSPSPGRTARAVVAYLLVAGVTQLRPAAHSHTACCGWMLVALQTLTCSSPQTKALKAQQSSHGVGSQMVFNRIPGVHTGFNALIAQAFATCGSVPSPESRILCSLYDLFLMLPGIRCRRACAVWQQASTV